LPGFADLYGAPQTRSKNGLGLAGLNDRSGSVVTGTGMDTLEVLTRLRGSSIDGAVLEGLRITVDRLCSEYPYLPA
jgi:hypothetical protein